MPKRKPCWISEGRPHSYGSLLCGTARRGPKNVLSSANVMPTTVPRPTKTIAGR